MNRNCPCCNGLETYLMMSRPLCGECEEEFMNQFLNRSRHESIVDCCMKTRNYILRLRREGKELKVVDIRPGLRRI